MTRDEEIKAAAKEGYVRPMGHGNDEGLRKWGEMLFICGSFWADEHPKSPWISVNDKLPKKKEVVLIHCYPYGVITALFDDAWEGVEAPVLFYSTDAARQLNEVDYWMPIPPIPTKDYTQEV